MATPTEREHEHEHGHGRVEERASDVLHAALVELLQTPGLATGACDGVLAELLARGAAALGSLRIELLVSEGERLRTRLVHTRDARVDPDGVLVDVVLTHADRRLGVLRHALVRPWSAAESTFARGLASVVANVLERERHHDLRADAEVDARWRVLFVDNPQGIARGELREPIPLDLPPDEVVRRLALHGWIAECNDAYARIYGFGSAREVVGRGLPELLGVDRATAERALGDALGGAFVKPDWERLVQIRDGRWRWLLGNTIPFVEGGRFVRWWATITDITERKRQEQLLAQLASATTGTGPELFQALAHGLGDALGLDVVFVAVLDAQRSDHATIVAAWSARGDGPPVGNEVGSEVELEVGSEVELGAGPEARVARGALVVHERGVGSRYPDVPRLSALEGWLGVPLLGAADVPEGMIVGMRRQPLGDPPPEHVLRIVAARAQAELARTRTESALQLAQARLEEALGRSERRVVQLEEQVGASADIEGMAGQSAAMRHVHRRLRLVAQSDVTVLVTGETGTGKELAASAIHQLSGRAAGPFVALSCVELPETLLESELFGHVRGAFTGAHRDKVGLFEAARGGTLFLDEIGELPLVVQAKLLRVLQERQVRRVGDHRPTPVDVRLVCATHRDLRALVRSGGFREDLFFRIHVFELHLPPLSERKGDIPLLASRFIEELGQRHGKVLRGIDSAALDHLIAHGWPGNVRELRNAIEHAVVTATADHIRLEDLPRLVDARGETIAPRADADLAARIAAALADSGGHRENAARALGMSRVTLWKKMKALGLHDA